MTSKRSADYASFKVGVPESVYDECVKPQFWPKGFKAERWLFRSNDQYRRRQNKPKEPNNLTVYYQNVRWLKTKLLEWRNNLIISDDLQLVAATETNTDESVRDAELCGAGGGWAVLRRDRRARTGGGVLLAARAPLLLERLPEYETRDGEDLWAKFLFHGQTIYVCVMYIPPGSSDNTYMEWFKSVEKVCEVHTSSKILTLGDLNLYSASDNMNNNFKYFSTFCDMQQYNGVKNKNARMLDVVLTGVTGRFMLLKNALFVWLLGPGLFGVVPTSEHVS
ncbi:hypothetical protein O0L34_g17497 [Tuta absoluta]|nr:hypothetical protein O0L34_g17497 [Tuta absoluta]